MRLLAVSLVLLASTVPFVPAAARADAPAAVAPAPNGRDRFAGNYTFVGGDKQKAALDAAIDKAVESMFFAIRPIARGKLHDKTEIKTSIGFAFSGGNITSTSNGEAPATSPESGAATPFKAGGETLKLSQKVTPEGHLLQTFAAGEGTRTNDYSLSADGKMLNVAVTVSSKKLNAPLHYALTYKKS